VEERIALREPDLRVVRIAPHRLGERGVHLPHEIPLAELVSRTIRVGEEIVGGDEQTITRSKTVVVCPGAALEVVGFLVRAAPPGDNARAP
jgi:hypothetical protein